MGTAQEQALRTEWFQQNVVLFIICTAADGDLKKHIVTTVQSLFLSPLVDQLTSFVQATALQMIHHLFNSYGAIAKTDPEEKAVNMIGSYDPAETVACLIEQL